MSNLIYIMGKSSSGKDTVYQKIKEKINTNVYVLYTTRPKRDGEEDGKEYNFISRNEFNKLKEEGKVIEARHYGVVNEEGENDIWTYATIDDEQWNKEGDFLTIGTLESYSSIKEYLENHPERNLKLLPVYIYIDEEERIKRATIREEQKQKPNFDEMKRRIKADNYDFSDKKRKEVGINENNSFENNDLEFCVSQILNYIKVNTLDDGYKIEKLIMKPTQYNSEKREEIKKNEKEIIKGKSIDGDER